MMDRHMRLSLDRWLTTEPEEEDMANIDEMIYGHMTEAELHEGISSAHDRINDLTAENASLRNQNALLQAELKQARWLLSRLDYTTMPPYDTEAISEFLAKYEGEQ